MSDLLQQRYGGPRPRQRLVVMVASAAVGALFLAWVLWAAWFHSDPAIDASLVSYDVVSSHEVRVKIDARFRDDQVQGTCLVRATAADHSVVGELNVTADQIRSQHGRWIPIRTERRATSVVTVSCTEAPHGK